MSNGETTEPTEAQIALVRDLIYGINPNADEAWVIKNWDTVSAQLTGLVNGILGGVSNFLDDVFDGV